MSVLTRDMRTVNLMRRNRTTDLEQFMPEMHSTPKSSDLQLERTGQHLKRRPDLLPHSPRSDIMSSSLDMEKEQERLEKLILDDEREREWNQPRKIVDVFRDSKSVPDYLQLKDDIKTLSSRPNASPKRSPSNSPRHHARTDAYDNSDEYDDDPTGNYYETDETEQPGQTGDEDYTMPAPWSKIMSLEPPESTNEDSTRRQWRSFSAKSSMCSEKSSRLDSHTYQSYTAGLLHSSGKSEKFLNLQKHYSVLERISELEKKRSKSVKNNGVSKSLHTDNSTEDEELQELYLELDEAKKNREFFSRKSEHVHRSWNPNADKGLMQKQKSLQDLKMKYNTSESSSGTKIFGTRSLGREKKFADLAEKFKLFDDDFNQSINSSKSKRQTSWPDSGSYINDHLTIPASGKNRHGTHNKYEIYVEEKQKDHKLLKGQESLHIRSFSAPNTQKEVETESPLIRTNSSKESFFASPSVEQKAPLPVSPLSVIHGRKIMATYVNENPALWNEYTDDFKKESLPDKTVTLDVFSRRGVDTSPIQDVRNCVQIFENRESSTGFLDNRKVSSEARTPGVGRQKEEIASDSVHTIRSVFSTQHSEQITESGSRLKFHVRDLRALADNNEFSQSKFALKPQVDRQPMMEKYLEDVLEHSKSNERLELIDGGQERSYSSIPRSPTGGYEMYAEERKWGHSDIFQQHNDTSDDSESVGSDESAGTFIVKHSDEDSDENLPDVTKGTSTVRFAGAGKMMPKARSVPDIKNEESDQTPQVPRSAKSQLSLNKETSGHPISDGTSSSNVKSLRELFHERKEEGKRNRLQFDKDGGKLKLNHPLQRDDVATDNAGIHFKDSFSEPGQNWRSCSERLTNDVTEPKLSQREKQVKKFVLIKKPLELAVSSKSEIPTTGVRRQDMPIKKKSPIILKRGFLQQSMPNRYYHTISGSGSQRRKGNSVQNSNNGGGTLPKSSGRPQDQMRSKAITGHYYILRPSSQPCMSFCLCFDSSPNHLSSLLTFACCD